VPVFSSVERRRRRLTHLSGIDVKTAKNLKGLAARLDFSFSARCAIAADFEQSRDFGDALSLYER
jgi:hypothetical protein